MTHESSDSWERTHCFFYDSSDIVKVVNDLIFEFPFICRATVSIAFSCSRKTEEPGTEFAA